MCCVINGECNIDVAGDDFDYGYIDVDIDIDGKVE